jgi:hypothetical protein
MANDIGLSKKRTLLDGQASPIADLLRGAFEGEKIAGQNGFCYNFFFGRFFAKGPSRNLATTIWERAK